MSDHERGLVDTSAAEVYDTLFVPALFGRFASHVADLVDPGPASSVIDIACGTGALTRLLASETEGRVVGVDINPGMLAVAERHGGQIEYGLADATDLPFDDGEFDVAVNQFGLMFVPESVAAVREMLRVASRGVVAVWDAIESTGYADVQELFREELGDDAAASLDFPFALGAPGALRSIVDEAGCSDASIARIEGTGHFSSSAQWVTTEVRGWTLGDSVSDEQLADLVAAAEEKLARYTSPQGVTFPMAALVASW